MDSKNPQIKSISSKPLHGFNADSDRSKDTAIPYSREGSNTTPEKLHDFQHLVPGIADNYQKIAAARIKKKKQDLGDKSHASIAQDLSFSHQYQDSSQLYLNQNQSMLPVNTSMNQPTGRVEQGQNSHSMLENNSQILNNTSFDASVSPMYGSSHKRKKVERGYISTDKPTSMDQKPIFTEGMSGLEKLNQLNRIFIKQKLEMLEMLTGCETENRYKVFAANQKLEKFGEPIFKCKEKSSFTARNCLSGDCRPFEMRILHEDRQEDDDNDDMFLHLDRPCKCTICCFQRPEISVAIKENGQNKNIGKITSDWALCDMRFTVIDRNNKEVYKIHGSCCQCGLYFNCPCKPCSKVIFNIQSLSGENLGEIVKIYSGGIKEMLTDTDNFCCVYPAKCPPENKALLLAAVLFIDFRYFEQSPQQNNGLV